MSTDHRVWTSDPDGWAGADRVYWECSCGASGSCSEDQAGIASDRHIQPGESRSDVSKPEWPS